MVSHNLTRPQCVFLRKMIVDKYIKDGIEQNIRIDWGKINVVNGVIICNSVRIGDENFIYEDFKVSFVDLKKYIDSEKRINRRRM